jgi:hypothetical protein
MEISEEFFENSILEESLVKTLKEDYIDVGSEDLFHEIITMFFEQANVGIKEYPNAVQHLKSRKYSLARLAIDRFDYFHSSVVVLRKTIKSLISGIVITSAIADQMAIADYRIKWKHYDENERSKYTFFFHHQVIYQQFKKVNTLEELAEFNEQFHQYLVEMAFKLAEIIIRKMSYTIEYLKDDDVLKDSCNLAAVHLELFQAEIEKLKKNQYQ